MGALCGHSQRATHRFVQFGNGLEHDGVHALPHSFHTWSKGQEGGGWDTGANGTGGDDSGGDNDGDNEGDNDGEGGGDNGGDNGGESGNGTGGIDGGNGDTGGEGCA
tara:strand:- start:1107 stop:1427 length:321 start_codon:yes stop_codon:yes gene_type:complete